MEREKTGEAVEAFRRYAQAFQTLDPKAVVPHFHEPALFIAPHGTFALPNGAAVEQAYRGVMSELPAMGYARTDFSQICETRLSDDLAVVSGAGAWKNASGKELSRFGMTYTMRRTGQTWRIVVAAIHDPVNRG
jgi:ketosteroid isomerase-like protein